VGGMETRRIGKSDGTSTIKRASFPLLKSCKVDVKLLITSRTMQIV
jgi:hypothetical protein